MAGGKRPGAGRPLKLTPEVHKTIVQALEQGMFIFHAAPLAGVHYTTVENWISLGRQGVEPYVQFAIDCDRAKARDVQRNQLAVSAAATSKQKGDWKAAAWNLARKHPKIYGSAAQVKAEREVELEVADKARRQSVYSPWKQDDAIAGDDSRSDFDA